MSSAVAAEHFDPESAAVVLVDGHNLTLEDVAAGARGAPVALPHDPGIRRAIEASRKLKGDLIARGVPLYGITTGFGDSVHRQIAPSKADRLQLHLIRGLGAGTGVLTPEATARAVVLVGTRDVYYKGSIRPAADAMREAGVQPLELESKEGLGLVNGTAFMTGIGTLAAVDARRLAMLADICTAMATEVLNGITGPFDPFIHETA